MRSLRAREQRHRAQQRAHGPRALAQRGANLATVEALLEVGPIGRRVGQVPRPQQLGCLLVACASLRERYRRVAAVEELGRRART